MTQPRIMSSARKLLISGPFGATEVSVEHLQFFESLGAPFSGELSIASLSPDLDISSVVGRPITISIDLEGGLFRYVNAYVTSMALIGTFERQARYHATLRPWVFLLSGRKNSRIFQEQSIVDIATALFREHGFSDFEDKLDGTYTPVDFVVQYEESDFAFVSRLLEKAGIYYYFRHEDGRHVLVLADALSASESPDGYATVPFHPEGSSTPGDDEFISAWQVVHQWKTGAAVVKDFDFTRPKANLLAQALAQPRHDHGDYESFEYPGGYKVVDEGTAHARVLLEESQSDVEVVHGSGSVQGLGTGNIFALIDHPSDVQNKSYLLISSAFDVSNTFHVGGTESGDDAGFQFTFSAIDVKTPFRPARRTPQTRVKGPQTAIVVGQSGEEIWTDKYGRVKVQFHWDREGKDDENSSCWVRVSQAWAGSGWGSIHIPRIGQEVIVDFLEGDPDRPIITGRVYNAVNKPPYDLPANRSQSGFKSRSTKGGAPTNFNELRFEDKKGSEQVYLQAEKNLQTLIKNDEQREVGHDRSEHVGNNETVTIGANRTKTVGANETIVVGASRTEGIVQNDTLTVGGNRSESVSKNQTVGVDGNRSVSVANDDSTSVTGTQSVDVGKDQSVTISGGRTLSIAKDDAVTISGKLTVNVSKDEMRQVGKKLVIDVADEVTIKTGDASLVMKKNGDITLKGKNITLDGSGKINVKASGNVIIKGSKVTQN